MDLDTFMQQEGLAARSPGGVGCATCALPAEIRHEIEEARKRLVPVSFGVLSLYLRSMGHNVTSAAVAGHFRKGHV
jgi:hypothetical protein